MYFITLGATFERIKLPKRYAIIDLLTYVIAVCNNVKRVVNIPKPIPKKVHAKEGSDNQSRLNNNPKTTKRPTTGTR